MSGKHVRRARSSGARRQAATAIAAAAVSGLALAVPLAGSASAATATPAVSAGTPQDATVQTDAPSPLSVTTTSLPAATAGTAYSQQLAAAGGTGPYTWALASGTLPGGLALSASGTISGTPASSGTSTFTVQVTDSTGATAVAQLTLAGNPAPPLVITTTSLPAATLGAAYSQQLTVTGGVGASSSYSWGATGLPAGLTVSPGGVLSGTPATPGTYDITVTAADAENPAQTVQQQLTLTVDVVPLSITTSLPAATPGIPYSQVLTAAGGVSPYTWAATGLPAGLTLSTAGRLSGMPPATPGTYDFTVTAADAENPAQSVQQQLTLTVNPQPPLVITTTSLPAVTVGTYYSQRLTSTGGVGSYSYLWHATGLPAGMSLGVSNGILEGAPTTPGTYDITVTLSDEPDGTQSVQQQLTLTVNALPLVITTSSLPAATAGTAYSQQLRTTGGFGPYTWTLASGTLPAGLTLSASGIISGTPTGAGGGSSSVSVQVTDSTGATAVAQLTLTGNPAPPLSVTTTSLPAATAGLPYSQQLAAAGGTGPYTWSLASGTLPAGLTLSASGGLSAGVPGITAAPGTYDFTVTAADAENPAQSVQQQLTLTVNPEPPLVITTSSLPAAAVGTAYRQQLTATGGASADSGPFVGYPYTWQATGLPAGMTLTSVTGVLSGTPTTPGTYDITVTASVASTDDPYFPQSVQQQLTLTVNALPLVITTSSLPAATAGTAYSQQLRTTGGFGPYTWTLASGTLPAGLTLSASGIISGTPTGAGGGSSSVSVQVTDSTGATAVAQLTLTGNPAPPLSVTTTSLPAATAGLPYSQQLAAAGGTGPYTWSLASGTLPAGLTLSASGGLSAGVPGITAAPGTYDFTVTAADAENPAQSVQQQLTLTVNPEPPLVITTSSLPAAAVGTAYRQQLTATGGASADSGPFVGYPYTWQATGLPAGMTLTSVTGVLSGTPTTPGTYDITVTASVASTDDPYFPQSVQQQLTLTVNALPLVITTSSLPAATAGTAYSQQLRTTGGFGPYTWTLASGTLPAGLTLSASGLLSGTPTAPGTYSVSVTAADGESPAQTVQQQLTLTVNAAPLSITTKTLPAATAGAGYGQQLAAAGGTGAYTWALASGTLPEGLALSTSGTISGTPAGSGTSTFTVQATDGESPAQTVQQQLTLTVNAAPLSITTKTLPTATAGAGYGQQLAAAGGTGPYTWSLVSGTLPEGLALSASGTISGTPAGSGTSTFTVQATDGENPAQTVRQQFTLTVHAAPLVITTRSLPTASVDRAYSQQLRAVGGVGPYSWSLASGRLPAGITLSREGAPRGEPWAAGTYAFTVRATDSAWPAQSVTERLSITVAGEKADLAVSVTGPSSAQAGSRVIYTVTVKDNGPAWASRVSVSLEIAGLTDVKASDAGRVKLAESRDVAQASAAWYAAGIAPGQTLTFTITGTVGATGLKDVSATGQVQSPTSDPNPRNNTSTVTTKVR